VLSASLDSLPTDLESVAAAGRELTRLLEILNFALDHILTASNRILLFHSARA
jgi:hypothetical protein